MSEAPERIALCFGTYPPERNGGSDFVARLAHALARRGHEVHVLTSARETEGTELDGAVHVHRVVRDWGLSRAGRRQADSALRAVGAEVVHVLFPDSVIQERYQLPAVLGVGRAPIVTTWWNLGLGRRSPMSIRLQSLALLARSRVLTSHTPEYLRVLRLARAGRPVEWLPVGNNLVAAANLVPRESARGVVEFDPEVAWLGFFGQVDPTRGLEDLFQALARIRRTRDVRLVMIGSAGRSGRYRSHVASSAYLETILELPDRLGIGDAIRWTDYLPDQDVLTYLRAIDLCVLPYRRNSLGRSALASALEVGAPTVLAGSPGAIAPLQAGRHVELAPRADPGSLAAAIARLLDNPGLRAGLEEGARQAAPRFSWESIAETAAAIYRQAVRR